MRTALGSADLTTDRSAAPFDNIVLPLTGIAFQNISSIDFRINSTGGGVEYTNIAINGIPEPSGSLLTVLAGMLAMGRRRR